MGDLCVRLGEEHRRDTCLIERRSYPKHVRFGQELLLLHAKLSMFGKFSVHVSLVRWCEGLGEEHSISVYRGPKPFGHLNELIGNLLHLNPRTFSKHPTKTYRHVERWCTQNNKLSTKTLVGSLFYFWDGMSTQPTPNESRTRKTCPRRGRGGGAPQTRNPSWING